MHIPREYLENNSLVNLKNVEEKLNYPPSTDDYEINNDVKSETPSTSKVNSGIHTPVVGSIVKKRGTIDEADYLTGPVKSVQRRRSDPRISISQIFREIYQQINSVPNATPLQDPVNSKKVLFNFLKFIFKKLSIPITTNVFKNQWI